MVPPLLPRWGDRTFPKRYDLPRGGLAAASMAWKHFKVLHQNNAILTVITTGTPTVDPDERVTVDFVNPSFARMTLKYGFMETPNVPKALVYQDINNNDTMTARLLRKFWVANGNVDNLPVEMARAATAAGVVPGVRVAADTTILSNPINNANSFY
jgi:hypothetical protein